VVLRWTSTSNVAEQTHPSFIYASINFVPFSRYGELIVECCNFPTPREFHFTVLLEFYFQHQGISSCGFVCWVICLAVFDSTPAGTPIYSRDTTTNTRAGRYIACTAWHKAAFHDTDIDILADILARIVAWMSACRATFPFSLPRE